MNKALIAIVGVLLGACGSAVPLPSSLQPGTACSHCRMNLLDATLAAQIAAPGEEPRFFDDIGCLAAYLAAHPVDPASRAYVADHRDGAWVEASQAVYGRDEALDTPMSSHLFAHATAASRSADASVHAAKTLTPSEVFGPQGLPGGERDR